MPASDGFRKWWHIELDIEDRNSSVLQSFTTINELDVNSNADSSISARPLNCGSTLPIPPRAWDYDESPGYFIFRPDLETLTPSIKQVTSYNDVINVDNRRVFKYKLRAAYNDLDIYCAALIPTVLDPSVIQLTKESTKSIVFEMPEIEFLTQVGCCSLDGEIPDPLPDQDSLIECSRIWYIVDETSSSHLYSYDVLTNDTVDRGEISWPFGLNSELYYHDLAWDNRNYLWGLDREGLTRILVGDVSTNAYALNYSNVDNPFSDTVDIFPIDDSINQGEAAMSFNQYVNRMYIYSNRRFWELQPTTKNDWEVTKVSYIMGEGEVLGDFAFSTDGKCYCIYNNKLATISFDDRDNLPFGYISYVNEIVDYSNFVGLDFVYDSTLGSIPQLYGIKTTGQIFFIDSETGEKTLYSGSSISDIAVGLSSCQAGEDLRTLPFPFFPGESPWLFVVDNSSKISGQNIENIKNTLTEFVSNYIRKGDYFSIITYNDSLSSFGPREMKNTDDVQSAKDFINSFESIGSFNFCNALVEISNVAKYHNLQSIIVLSDGSFTDCGDTDNEIKSNIDYYYELLKINNPQVTLYSVGINPTNETYLKYLGEIGGGGYVKWQ